MTYKEILAEQQAWRAELHKKHAAAHREAMFVKSQADAFHAVLRFAQEQKLAEQLEALPKDEEP